MLSPHVFALVTRRMARWLMALMHIERQGPAPVRGGGVLLEYGWVYRGVSSLLLVGPPAAIVALARSSPMNPSDVWPVGAMFVSFLVGGAALSLETFGTRCAINEDGIHHRSIWSGSRLIRWDELARLEWSEVCRWWVLVASDGRRARIHEGLRGAGAIAMVIAEYAPPGSSWCPSKIPGDVE